MIVFDITNRNSFENVAKWIDLSKIHTNNSTRSILIGNKVDIQDLRQVSFKEAKDYAGIIY
jgi:GTPase SAR1 family protein